MDKHCLSRVLGCPHTLGKTFSSPVYQPSDAEFVHPSLMIFFINILSHCGEAAHSQRKLFGHRNRCSSCVVLSLVSVFCCPVLTGTVSLGQECRLHRLQSGVSGAGACSSPNGCWQNPEPCCRTEALNSWRLPSLCSQ